MGGGCLWHAWSALPQNSHSAAACTGPLQPLARRPAAPAPAATLLGATLGDRLRVNAKWAQRGMAYAAAPPGGGGAAGELQYVGALRSRLTRWRLALHVGLLRLAFWLSSLVVDLTHFVDPQ